MLPMVCMDIKESVGVGGKNRPEDVRAIRRLLNQQRDIFTSPLPLIGTVDDILCEQIRRFQYYSVGLLKPDGRVDPGGKTLRRLNMMQEPSWMKIARGEMGVREIRKKGQHNARIVAYLNTTTNISQKYRDRDETAWCSAFVNWCLQQSGISGTNHALATSWKKWGYALTEPRPGAVTVIHRKGASSDAATGSGSGNHVAFFVEAPKRTRLTLLGGNQGGGWQVQESTYSLGSYEVLAYRWPNPPSAK